MKTSIAIILFVFLFLCSSNASAIDVCGTISSSTTWTLNNSPYFLRSGPSGCPVTVNAGVTLTIQAGVQVKGPSNAYLQINGTLSAVGTSANPIVFTTSSGTPAAGQWGGLYFGTGAGPSASQVTYATISYAGQQPTIPAGLHINGSSPTLSNVTVSFSSRNGLYVTGSAATPSFSNGTVNNNTLYGINLISSGGLNLTNSTISNNTDYAIGAEPNTRLLGLTGLTLSGNGSGSKNSIGYRTGTTTTNETWRSPVVWTITGMVTIGTAGILTVEAGTTAKFASGAGIDVSGRLNAIGTSGSLITFTSNATTPAPGNWNYIKFNSGANPSASQISYSTISYAGQSASFPGAIYVSGSSPTFSNLTVSFCLKSGITSSGSTATPVVSNSTLNNNTIHGVNLVTSGGINLTNSSISNNTDYAVGAEANTRLTGLTGLTITGNGGGTKNSVGYRGGSITTNEVWRSPVTWTITTTTATISSTGTLTVDPGTTVKFASNTGIDVSGRLTAVGTSGSLITFTSNATTPAPGNWNFVKFNSGANPSASQISYATISYAGQSSSSAGAVYINGSSPTLNNLTINYSLRNGIMVTSSSATPIVANAVISNNTIDGVNLVSGGGIDLSSSTMSNNTNYAVGLERNTRLLNLTAITLSGNGAGLKNAVNHRGGGITTVDETWRSGIPTWVLTGILTIGTTKSITVQPGISVKIQPGTGTLNINGALIANGTPTSPIQFTSNASVPASGDWGALWFISGSSPLSQISYAAISYGGRGGNVGAVLIDSSSPTFDHVTFTNNRDFSIKVQGTSSPVIKNCSFSGSTYGINNATTTNIITAALNYWNASNGPSGAGSGSGLQVSAGVNYEPWIMSAPSVPHFFSVVEHQNRTFNPTINVYSGVNFTSTQSGSYFLKVYNSLSQLIRTISGSGSAATPTWDGKNDAGIAQLPGTYTYELSSTATGGAVAAPVTGSAIIDNSLQLLVSNFVITPNFFSPNADLVQDTAIVSASFSFYSSWTINIKNSGGSSVTTVNGNGNSIAYAWNGASQPDGLYTAFLTVTAGTSSFNDSRTVTIDTIFPVANITSPVSSQTLSNIYQNGSSDVPIIGTASDLNINNWNLERGTGPNPGSWTIFATGTLNVINTTIANWPTIALTNGIHTIRLRNFDKAGNATTSASVTLTVSNFKVTQDKVQMNTSFTDPVTYTSTVPFALTETLLIKDPAGQTIKTLFSGTRNPGTYTNAWAGLNESGSAMVADGLYKVIANVQSGTYNITWDQSSEYINPLRRIYQVIAIGDDPFNNNPPNLVSTEPLWEPGKTLIICSPDCIGIGQNGLQEFVADDDCIGTTACPVQYEYLPTGPLQVPWAATDSTGVYRRFCGCVMFVEGNSYSKNNVILFGRQPKITNLTVSPPLYAPERGNQTISYTLTTFQNQPANISITILNQDSVSVLRNITQNNVNPGSINIQWDGKADNGMHVAPGNYTITVVATTPVGQSRKTPILTTIQY